MNAHTTAVETKVSALAGLAESQRSDGQADQEGWIVAYADLITLLFIFFALLLSVAKVNHAKFEMLSEQFNQNSESNLYAIKKLLDQEIAANELKASVSTQMTPDGLQVHFNDTVLFPSGKADLSAGGLGVLGRFSKVLGDIKADFKVAVEGHTDHRPIHNAEFRSNWELSSQRSVNVLHQMAASGLDEKRLMVRAYADTRPLTAAEGVTASEEDLAARNRRVTLVVF